MWRGETDTDDGDPGAGAGGSGMAEGLLGMAVVSASEAHTCFLHIGRRSISGLGQGRSWEWYIPLVSIYALSYPQQKP